MSQKLDNNKLRCAQGSHFFNGSCYFISNKKFKESSTVFESDILDYLKQKSKKARSGLSALSSIDTKLSLPIDASWNKAVDSCRNLNNDSTLIHFANDSEYTFLINLLIKLHFPGLADENKSRYNEEQKYYIGLTYNSEFIRLSEN